MIRWPLRIAIDKIECNYGALHTRHERREVALRTDGFTGRTPAHRGRPGRAGLPCRRQHKVRCNQSTSRLTP